ncbi:hypothetical protein KUCAC02_024466, partial [Chaenocephalus aceratus]
GVVWWGYRSSEGPHITRGLRWLTVINDQKSGPSHTPLNTVDPNRSVETLHLHEGGREKLIVMSIISCSCHGLCESPLRPTDFW